MKLHKTVCVLLAALLVAALSGCLTSEDFDLNHISRMLSVNCTKARLMEKYDSHGGFLGDGTSFYVFNFDGNPPLRMIKDSGKWKPFPVSENVQDILWGLGNPDDDNYKGPPLITKEGDEAPLFPRVENGFYFFRDRHSDAVDPYDDTHVFDESRFSYNFSVAIYDADTDRLYFAEFDT